MRDTESWGRFIRSAPARVVEQEWTSTPLPSDDLLLPYGMGRSYGDVCLNNGHTLLSTTPLARLRHLDEANGLLVCEAGVTLDDLLDVIVPRGWFVPVTPGTKFVTVGGCIANDVHGKNHHRAGSFGNHVRALELVRSDRSSIRCSEEENRELFHATIGGLGLTGMIVTAEIALRRIASAAMVVEQIPFQSLSEFDALSRESDASHEYTVAWLDAFGGSRSRGIFFRGNHAPDRGASPSRREPRRAPLALFSPLLTTAAVRAFNRLYFRANSRPQPHRVDYDPFFYPLDRVANWNAIYGRRGFVQYQCVVPDEAGLDPIAEILDSAATSRTPSFLAVIKKFGPIRSAGMMSFPRAGTTLCLDFPGDRENLLPLLDRFDDVVERAGGSVYPAKDARMPGARFRRFFPQWEAFRSYVDPRFSSSFWRRVTE
ncbi:MAG TPA: FAD-binding oxidoreductase [Thermoanaerobaculia bacterium]|nr:FAD-binding oxidoreductase [Thermoanaerobaculia bacterium]